MRFEPTDLEGVFHVTPTPFEDARGAFMDIYLQSDFAERDIPFAPAQQALSVNLAAGTLRGLHYQLAPHEQAKLVRCVRGAVFDVAVDIRPDSPNLGQWVGETLTAEGRNALFVPKGFAHGFQTLAEDAEVAYLIDGEYMPALERGIRWDDPDVGVRWPSQTPVLSDRDQQLPLLTDASLPAASLPDGDRR